MSDVAKFNEKSAVTRGLPTNMDPEIREITAPWGFVGWVPAIHEKGEEHPFQVTEYELELLVRQWAEEIRDVLDAWEATELSDSYDNRMAAYAGYRLRKIQDILGQERVQRIVDKAMCERRSWRQQFERRVAVAHGLHAAILLEELIQDAESHVEYAASEGGKQCSLTDVCLSAPQRPTGPGDQGPYPYLTQAEFDAALQNLVEAGFIRESKGESAHERPGDDPKRYFFLTPLALPDASLGDSAKTSEQAHGATTATDESRSEGAR